ncbi:MAG: TIGR02757 family protein [Nitrospirae bacterium]|nr:TIGR02757 family protein [Nitrospirota bacterium]
MRRLKEILDRFYLEFDFAARIPHDPIKFPCRYDFPQDREVAGFIASCLAYGRVELFSAVVEKILRQMGESPTDFLLHFTVKGQAGLFSGITYRFNQNNDIICMLFILSETLKKHSSLEGAFRRFHRPDNKNIEKGLSGLMNEFLSTDTSAVYGRNIRPAGLTQFFPSPADGSACKRANLFLRWMIRDRDIDLGIWKDIPKSKLVIPLDTHIARISRCLGLTQRRSQDWKMAVEITEALKQLDSEDPLKYDFALCHHGISGTCKGLKNNDCIGCALRT